MGKRLLMLGALSVFLCAASHASFIDGNANKVFGQVDYGHTGINIASDKGLVDPYAVAIDTVNNRVYVADYDNNRVLWWNGISSFSNGQSADGVLGQQNFLSTLPNRGGSADINTLSGPDAVAVDGSGNVWVCDYSNSRVLRYSWPLSNGMDADKVLGQANFQSAQPNRGGGYSCTANTLYYPVGVAVSTDSASVWVVDWYNSRAVRYDAPFTNGMDASMVLGESSLTSSGGGAAMNRLSYAWGISIDHSGKIWIADFYNSRVIRFSPPFSTGMSADLTLTSYGTSGSKVNYPYAVCVDTSNNVFVSDSGNNRILHFSAPFSNNMAADMVIGQADYNGNLANQGQVSASADTLYNPMSGVVDPEGKLWIADLNHRVLEYDYPQSTGTDASLVFGQNDFDHDQPNITKNNSLYYPVGVTVDSANDRVFIADTNNRVLWWDSISSYNNGDAATGALGQANLTSGEPNRGLSAPTERTLTWPVDIGVDGSGKVWVVDGGNNRILRYTPPLATGMPADLVLGQPDMFTSSFSSGTGAGLNKLYDPFDVAFDSSNNVWVDDYLNSRILRFSGTLTSGQSADLVIGHTGTGSAAPNYINKASGIDFDSHGNLWVADNANARVIRFPAPLSTGMDADMVLGQSDFYSTGQGTSQNHFKNPTKAKVDSLGNVWVADRKNHRVVRYSVPLSSGMNADLVYGQADFISGLVNRGGMAGANTMNNPMDVALDTAGNLWVDDYLNSRVVKLNAFKITSISVSTGMADTTTDEITVTGQGIAGGTTIKLSRAGATDIVGSNVTILNGTHLTCQFDLTAPSGFWNVVLTLGGVTSTLEHGFHISLPIETFSVLPSSGINNASKDVSLAGNGFLSGTTIKLTKNSQSNIDATNIVVVSTGQINCRFNLIGAATGYWDVVTTTGSLTHTLSNGFQVVPMSVNSVIPAVGLNTGTKDVTINGMGFLNGATVKLAKLGQSNINATNVAFVSDAQITCRFNLAGVATGFWDITVSTKGVDATSAGGFEVVAIQVYSVAPSSGINNTTKDLTLTGAGFLAGTTVVLSKTSQSSIAATNINVVSATQITCRVDLNGAVAGYWNVIVSSGSASNTLINGFIVQAMQTYSVSPSSGINTASKNVTITGDGFLSGSTVKLSKSSQTSIAASSVTIVSASQITCRFDLTNAATGYWDVVVSSGSSISTLASGFKILPVGASISITTSTTTLTLDDADYTVVLSIPANTFSQNVVMTITKLKTTYGAGSQGLAAANMLFELSNDQNLQPLQDITATITYHDNVVSGVDKAKLALFYYNESSGQWIGLPSVATAATKTIVAQIHHCSVFRVFQRDSSLNDLSNITVYPNPFKPNSPGAYSGDTTLGKGIVFSGLTANCRIKIFTIAGELVRELNATGTDGTFLWDSLNDNGEKVASGVYIYFITNMQSDSQKAKGKLAIIR